MNLSQIRQSLSAHTPELIRQEGLRYASVALILRNGLDGLEMLFIKRAEADLDPWSGQIAFPGGGMDPPDKDLIQTAIRETLEEVGVKLTEAMLIGQIHDLQGSSRSESMQLVISCYVFHIDDDPTLKPNYEVAEAFWIPLSRLKASEHQMEYLTEFRPEPFPATDLGPGVSGSERILWGLTYRFVQQFLIFI